MGHAQIEAVPYHHCTVCLHTHGASPGRLPILRHIHQTICKPVKSDFMANEQRSPVHAALSAVQLRCTAVCPVHTEHDHPTC